MNEQILGKALIEIIKSILLKEYQCKLSFIQSLDIKELYTFAKFHSLEHFIHYAVDKEYINVSDEWKSKLKEEYQKHLFKTAVQDSEKEVITSLFETNEIKYMVLKGSVLKYDYPSIDMRSMADIDILIDKRKRKKIEPLMHSIGYITESLVGNHDVYYKNPFMNIELHKELIREGHELFSLFSDIWKRVMLKEDKKYEYIMTEEDFYLYLVAHSAKHYRAGGTGIRSILDVYIYLENHKLNHDYLEKEFEKFGLQLFVKNMEKLAYIWFGEEHHDEATSLMEEYIFSSGVYGTTYQSDTKSVLNQSGKSARKSKFKFLFKKIFPNYTFMKTTYSVLRYVPILLPFMYLYRILGLLFQIGKYRRRVNDVLNIKEDDIEKAKEIQEKTGY